MCVCLAVCKNVCMGVSVCMGVCVCVGVQKCLYNLNMCVYGCVWVCVVCVRSTLVSS